MWGISSASIRRVPSISISAFMQVPSGATNRARTSFAPNTCSYQAMASAVFVTCRYGVMPRISFAPFFAGPSLALYASTTVSKTVRHPPDARQAAGQHVFESDEALRRDQLRSQSLLQLGFMTVPSGRRADGSTWIRERTNASVSAGASDVRALRDTPKVR